MTPGEELDLKKALANALEDRDEAISFLQEIKLVLWEFDEFLKRINGGGK